MNIVTQAQYREYESHPFLNRSVMTLQRAMVSSIPSIPYEIAGSAIQPGLINNTASLVTAVSRHIGIPFRPKKTTGP